MHRATGMEIYQSGSGVKLSNATTEGESSYGKSRCARDDYRSVETALNVRPLPRAAVYLWRIFESRVKYESRYGHTVRTVNLA